MFDVHALYCPLSVGSSSKMRWVGESVGFTDQLVDSGSIEGLSTSDKSHVYGLFDREIV